MKLRFDQIEEKREERFGRAPQSPHDQLRVVESGDGETFFQSDFL